MKDSELKPLIILAAFLVVLMGLVISSALRHHGIVTGKERIPATRHINADGIYRTSIEAYYITVQKHSGEQVTFRVSEATFNTNRIGDKYKKG